MRRERVSKLGVGLLGLALLAASCGGDDKGSAGSSAKVDANVQKGVQDALNSASPTAAGSSTTAAKAPQTVDEMVASWATQRDVLVKRIKDNGWKYDAAGKKIIGADGYSVDLSKCPSTWNPTEGLTDTEIKIGHTTALSGTLADYGNIGRGMDALFKWVNDQGGIKDSTGKSRKITFVQKDDGYDAAKTIPLVDELLDNEKVFSILTLGSPNTMKVYDKINQRCVPQPFVETGHPAWGDPLNHPWTMGHAMAYTTEAILWGGYIDKTLPGAKVAGLVMNNDFGKAYELGFKNYIAQSGSKIQFSLQRIEPSAPTVTNEMTTIAASKPDVFIIMTAGTSCTQAYIEAQQNGLTKSAKQLWNAQTCKGLNFVGKDKAGDSTNGWLIAGGGAVDIQDKTKANDLGVKWSRDVLSKAGLDPDQTSQYGNGISYAWPQVQALQIAAALDGGLNRANFLIAYRSLELQHPLVVSGIKYNTFWGKDGYPIEGSEFARFDSAKQTYVQEGEIIDLSGKSAPCAWDQSISNCK